jgi:hypothetical protein
VNRLTLITNTVLGLNVRISVQIPGHVKYFVTRYSPMSPEATELPLVGCRRFFIQYKTGNIWIMKNYVGIWLWFMLQDFDYLHHIASNYTISESWIGKDLEGSGRYLSDVLPRHSPGETEGYTKVRCSARGSNQTPLESQVQSVPIYQPVRCKTCTGFWIV